MTRLTVACCITMTDDASHLAMCLGQSDADAQTYANLGWQDAQGNLYAAASFLSESMTQDPTKSLTRPAWDTEPYTVNMTGAARAQAALVVWPGEAEDPGDPPLAQPDKITVIVGLPGVEALAAMGLIPVPQDDEGGDDA